MITQCRSFWIIFGAVMLPKLTFVLGGASSGKSAFAESLVVKSQAPRVYLATSRIYDAEMRTKVADHIQSRGPDWQTIEEPRDMAAALAKVPADHVVLLDCASMWLTNVIMDEADLALETQIFLRAIAKCAARVVVVSNEVGMGVVPDTPLGRQFRDAQGKLNQELAEISDLAVMVVAGMPLTLKGTLP